MLCLRENGGRNRLETERGGWHRGSAGTWPWSPGALLWPFIINMGQRGNSFCKIKLSRRNMKSFMLSEDPVLNSPWCRWGTVRSSVCIYSALYRFQLKEKHTSCAAGRPQESRGRYVGGDEDRHSSRGKQGRRDVVPYVRDCVTKGALVAVGLAIRATDGHVLQGAGRSRSVTAVNLQNELRGPVVKGANGKWGQAPCHKCRSKDDRLLRCQERISAELRPRGVELSVQAASPPGSPAQCKPSAACARSRGTVVFPPHTGPLACL